MMYASSMQMSEQTLQEHLTELKEKDTGDETIRMMQQQLVEQLMVDEEIRESQQMFEKYPDLVQRARDKKGKLQEDANRSGKDKRDNDRFATKKVSAKWKLWRMESKRSKLEEKRYGKKLEVEQRSGKMHDFVLGQFNGQEYDTYSNGKVEKGRRSNVMDGFYSDIYGAAAFEEDDSIVLCHGYKGGLPLQRKNVSFAGGDLKGTCFEPANYDQQTGKVLIYYTGSGEPGSAEAGVGQTIQDYLRQGFKVYQVDYRGYGESAEGKQVAFSEAGFYQDGMDIYQSVLSHAGCSPSQIVMHGYSLGGAVASYVAGKVAQDTAKKYHGSVPADQKLGGLVLDSPMASLTKASQGSDGAIVGGAEGLLGSLAAGKYSAEEHLGTLYKNQPDIPIMFVSGGEADHLSIERTGIADKYPFNEHVVKDHQKNNHFGTHMTAKNLQDFMDRYGIPKPRVLEAEEVARLHREAKQRHDQRAAAQNPPTTPPPQADL